MLVQSTAVHSPSTGAGGTHGMAVPACLGTLFGLDCALGCARCAVLCCIGAVSVHCLHAPSHTRVLAWQGTVPTGAMGCACTLLDWLCSSVLHRHASVLQPCPVCVYRLEPEERLEPLCVWGVCVRVCVHVHARACVAVHTSLCAMLTRPSPMCVCGGGGYTRQCLLPPSSHTLVPTQE